MATLLDCPTCLEQLERGEKLSGSEESAVEVEPLQLCRVVGFLVELHVRSRRAATQELRLTLDANTTTTTPSPPLSGLLSPAGTF